MKKYKDVRTILSELGETLKLYRVSLNLSQADIEEKSGVSKRSISRLEQGDGIQLDNFIKVLSALNLEDNLSVLVPNIKNRPSYHLDKERKEKRRARKTREKKTTFQWGDEK